MRISALGETFIQDGMVRFTETRIPYKEIRLKKPPLNLSADFNQLIFHGYFSCPYMAMTN